MYVPSAFSETDVAKLHAFITRHSFGMLIAPVDGAPFATHVPFLLDPAAGPQGALLGHMAKANPHWRNLEGQQALAIFTGPHAYISPTWYEAENVVPTWNYTAVHAYGTIRLTHDADALTKILQDSVALYESSMPTPWSFDPASTTIQKLLPQIVGFRIEIDRLEGKFKLNQNQSVERQENVIQALQQQSGDDAKGIAALMQDRLSRN